ncbi:dual oxidase maturation factor 1-like [Clavelina lepadiformis]|uniref:Dual oxidase maturation factor 1 n=1 Tax=Clavelina lepadiformis TaxID=159417 RepID=A0ABP0H283_CLALP
MTLSDGFPPFYVERSSPVFGETSQYYLAYAFIAIFIGILLVLPGVKGRERIYFLLRWSLSFFIGATIIACLQGNSWHVGSVEGLMPFKVESEEMVNFKVGFMAGLSNFNVTLSGFSKSEFGGRLLFSEKYYYLKTDEEFANSLRKGLPFPILNVVEHFSVQKISSIWKFGRRYWVAGHYGIYMLWVAFAIWILANVLFHAVLRYGGLLLVFCGVLMIGANISFLSITTHNCNLEVHLGYTKDVVLRPTLGWCFWLCLSVGIFCILCGVAITIADHFYSKAVARFFNLPRDKDLLLEDIEVDTFSSGSAEEFQFESRRKSSLSGGETNLAFRGTDEESTQEDKTSSYPEKKSNHSSSFRSQRPSSSSSSDGGFRPAAREPPKAGDGKENSEKRQSRVSFKFDTEAASFTAASAHPTSSKHQTPYSDVVV